MVTTNTLAPTHPGMEQHRLATLEGRYPHTQYCRVEEQQCPLK